MGKPGSFRLLPFVSLAAILVACAIFLKPPRFPAGMRGHLFAGHHRGNGFDKNIKAMTAEGDFSDLEGFWSGTIEQVDLRILYRITAKGIVYNYSLDQGGLMIPAGTTNFNVETGKAVFWFPTIGGTYKATLDMGTDKNTMVGKWNQAGYELRLDMHRFEPPTDPDDDALTVPREYRFLLEKSIFGYANTAKLAGYWSGYVANCPDDAPELVILEVEKISETVVEPKIWQPASSPLPFPDRSLYLDESGRVKVVVDFNSEGVNAVFEGQLSSDGKSMIGKVFFDDQHYAPPLELKWSDKYPADESAEKKENTSI